MASSRASDFLQREANIQIAQANAVAATARLETLKLQEKMAWRRLAETQSAALHEALAGQSFEVWTSWVGNDPEATLFRNEIDKALTNAGLKTKYFSGWEMALGLKIAGPDTASKAKLIDAFNRAGLHCTVEGPSSFMKDDLVIIVGTKPEPE